VAYGEKTGPMSWEVDANEKPGAFAGCCSMGIMALVGGIMVLLGIILELTHKGSPIQDGKRTRALMYSSHGAMEASKGYEHGARRPDPVEPHWCPSCGSMMRQDPYTGGFYCPQCGPTQ
jgi:hypothetical protein